MDIAALNGLAPAVPAAPVPVHNEMLAQNREVIQAVRSLNAAETFGQENELTYVLDRETRRPVIRLVDRKTQQVIQQIPPEHVLELAKEAAAHRGG